VEITHGNLAHLIDWHRNAFQLTPDDRASQVAGLGFDAAVWEVWPTLVAGASLHLADEATRRSPLALRDWLVSRRITIAFVPTVLAEPLLHTDWPANTALRYLLTGADTLRRGPAAGLPFTLVNNYGPTECTVVATSGSVSSEVQGPPTIGRPIGQTWTFILGEDLKPVTPGEPGELCLAGPLVGRGYRNNPEETEKRFTHLVTDEGLPVRIYRTGDRVRQLENGEIAFLGRLDDQIKLRGFRIEPGEIVTCLSACPGVLSSAVVARDLGNDGPELVAYVVALPGAQLTVAGLREFLAPRLPDYMVPAHYVALATLPVTSGGKLDRAALPAPTADNLLPLGTTEDATSQGIPNAVAALVAALLNQPRVDPKANFFMLGGHSMLAAQLVAQIRDRFGVSLTLRQLFNAPTVAALASVVAQQTQAQAQK
jgi:acyl-CoA synthetase (AMP-forming)/AMP-acid ligase II/acyl carrier protein